MSTTTFAISGPAPCTYANAEALLGNWLGLGPKDHDGNYTLLTATDPELQILVIAPVTDERYTEAIANVLHWSGPALGQYVAMTDGQPINRPDVERAVAGAMKAYVVDDIDDHLLTAVGDQWQHGDLALLVLFDPDAPDEPTIRLMLSAKERGIPVFNLARGMMPIDADDYTGAVLGNYGMDEAIPASVPTAEPEAPVTADAAMNDVLDQLPEDGVEVTGTMIPDDPDIPTHVILDSLTNVVGIASNLIAVLNTRFRSPKLAEQILDSMPPAVPTPAPAPFDPVTELLPIPVILETAAIKPAEKTRREFKDPETGEWKPAGRGRPRLGYEYRNVPVEA